MSIRKVKGKHCTFSVDTSKYKTPISFTKEKDPQDLSHLIPDSIPGCKGETKNHSNYINIIRKRTILNKMLNMLKEKLSKFEMVVLEEYLNGTDYKVFCKCVCKKTGKKCKIQSIDSALLRIRRKGEYIFGKMDKKDISFLKKNAFPVEFDEQKISNNFLQSKMVTFSNPNTKN